jgi:membrane fusion protein (multidrug efflux system)
MKIISMFVFCLIGIVLLSCGSQDQNQATAPVIPVYQVQTYDIPIYQEFVGQVYGYKDIAIRARVEGFLEGIYFQEGSHVKQGAKLYSIESQPFEEAVAAKMSLLAEAQTRMAKAESDLNRIRPLAAQNAVSQSDLDGALAQYDASVSAVEAAEANLRAVKIQLSYTRIYSPIGGIIGRTKAKVGDFVGREPNPVILNVVSRIDTILVQFFITEAQYLRLARLSESDTSKIRAGRGKNQIRLILVDGTIYEHEGKLDFIDREVDPTTGAMLVQASFPNPDRLLRPGQFAKIKARLAVIPGGIMIPQRCIMELQAKFSVFIVNDKNTIERREVKVASKINNFWVIEEGLAAGDKVVYEGLQKVREGGQITPEPADIKPLSLGEL